MGPTEFLTHPLTHAAGLHVLCLHLFGTKYLGWEAETIWQEFKHRAGSEPSPLNRGKINACRTIHIEDEVFTKWPLFEKVIVTLNNTPVQFGVLQHPSPFALAHGVWAMMSLRSLDFSDEVETFIAGTLLETGLVYPPAPLLFVKERMAKRVPQELYTAMSRAKKVTQIAVPSDSALAYQSLRLRAIEDYLEKMQTMYEDSVRTAKRLVDVLQ